MIYRIKFEQNSNDELSSGEMYDKGFQDMPELFKNEHIVQKNLNLPRNRDEGHGRDFRFFC